MAISIESLRMSLFGAVYKLFLLIFDPFPPLCNLLCTNPCALAQRFQPQALFGDVLGLNF